MYCIPRVYSSFSQKISMQKRTALCINSLFRNQLQTANESRTNNGFHFKDFLVPVFPSLSVDYILLPMKHIKSESSLSVNMLKGCGPSQEGQTDIIFDYNNRYVVRYCIYVFLHCRMSKCNLYYVPLTVYFGTRYSRPTLLSIEI